MGIGTKQNRGRIAPLTGIRGVAAVWVILLHANLSAQSYGLTGTWPIIDRGYLGVDLFFVLSGFVLTMSYGLRLSVPSRAELRHFAIGRAWRILPLHWTIMLAFAALAVVIQGHWAFHTPHRLRDWVATFLLIQNWIGMDTRWNPPAWSLSAEWLAYLFFPAIVFVIWRVKHGSLALTGALLACASLPAFVLVTGHANFYDPRWMGLARCFSEFTTGVFLFRLTDLRDDLRRYGNWFFTGGLIILILVLSSKIFDPFVAFGFGAIVLACWSDAGLPRRCFGNAVVDWLGEVSFSLYIVHWLLLEISIYVGRGEEQPGTWLIAVSLAIAVMAAFPIAAVLNRYVETPSHHLGRRILRLDRTT